MIYRNRMLAGVVLAVLLAGGLGILVSQAFPSGSTSSTLVSTETSTASATSIVSTVTGPTTTSIASTTVTATVTSTATAASSTATSTATSVSTATSISSATSTVTTYTTTSAVTSSSTTCPEEEYCGGVTYESPTLEVASTNSSFPILSFTLVNAGTSNITQISVTVNGTNLGSVRGPQPGQTVIYLMQVPLPSVSAGGSYQVEIASSTFYGPGPSFTFKVVAGQ